MELVLITGIPGSGKSTYYRKVYEDRYLRLSMDQLGGRNARGREQLLFYAGLAGMTRMVIDSVNATRDDRARYIGPAKAAGYQVIGVHIFTPIDEALRRNALREGKARIPDKAVLGFLGRWQGLDLEEGFDQIVHVDQALETVMVLPEEEAA